MIKNLIFVGIDFIKDNQESFTQTLCWNVFKQLKIENWKTKASFGGLSQIRCAQPIDSNSFLLLDAFLAISISLFHTFHHL